MAALIVMSLNPNPYAAQADENPSAAAESMQGQTLLILGDSITYGGRYAVELEMAFRCRFPGGATTVLNLGLPSETISGLSEEGHAGGNFPRPDLHERLGRILERIDADFIFSCYGMNCGIYKPLSSGNLKPYLQGYEKLATAVRGEGASMIILTPPPFDPLPIIGRVTSDGAGGPFSGYDRVLETFSAALHETFSGEYPVIPVNESLTHYVVKRRITDPDFTLAGDGVHINSLGHHLVFESIAHLLGFDSPRVIQAPIRGDWELSLPDTSIPLPPDISMPAAEIMIFNNRFNAMQVEGRGAEGNLRVSYSPDKNDHDRRIFDLISRKHAILKDLWLTETGHLRPGMRSLEPFESWSARAAELEEELRKAIDSRPAVQVSFISSE